MMKCRYKKDFSGLIGGFGAKAGLEHRSYPYDLKRVKLIMLGMIPSLIPSVPIGDNRTKSISILFAYTNFDFIYIINTYIASSRI